MAYTKYSLTPANNNATPPDGAPEGMLPSAVNDTMRDMMAQIRDVGDGIRGGTYTMTAPVITGGTVTGVAFTGNTFTSPVISGGSINNTPIGASTANTGAFTTLSATGATTFSGATVVSGSLTANTFSSSGATITGGTINSTAIGGTTAAAGKFTTLEATGVTTVQAGTVSAPAITTSGDTNTGIFFPAADTIAFTEGGVEAMRIDSNGQVSISANNTTNGLLITQTGSGNALLVEDSANPDATPFVIDALGKISVGSLNQYTIGTITPYNQWNNADNQYASIGLTSWQSGTGTCAKFIFARGDSGTVGDFSNSVDSGDVLGSTHWFGSDGTVFVEGASISSVVDAAPSASSMPARLVFSTTASGSSTPTERMRIDSAGRVGIGTSSLTGTNLIVNKNLTGSTNSYNIGSFATIQSDVTSSAVGYLTTLATQATTFTLSSLQHFSASQSAIGAGSTVTNQYGFLVNSNLTGATNNYGFYSNIASGTNRWNFYANGTAANYFAGTVQNGSTISVGGATPAASGAGVTFPATQSASSDANTLDDYEEGTWTPSLSAQTTAPTGVTYDAYRYGRYTKIGRMVYARATVVITSKGTGGVGDVVITGLPFAAGDYSGYAYVPVECIYYPSGGITGDLFGMIIDNNSFINLSSATTPTNLISWSTLSNSEKISINVVYQV